MRKKIVSAIMILCFLCSLCACKKSIPESTSAKPEESDVSSKITDDGLEIDVRFPSKTGNGSTVKSVRVLPSGATVINISKRTVGDDSKQDTSSKTDEDSGDYKFDYVLNFNTDNIKILQLTDFNVINSDTQRPMYKMSAEDTEKYKPEKIKELLFDRIDELIKKSKPDLIVITGNMVDGLYDDTGASLKKVIEYFEAQKIFWAPVFGDKDNISARGVSWQCKQFESAKYCLFNRNHTLGGNSTCSIGISCNNIPKRALFLLDSNGCVNSTDSDVRSAVAFTQEQRSWLLNTYGSVKSESGEIPSFVFFHNMMVDLKNAVKASGYEKDDTSATYEIGKDVTAVNNDFGTKGAEFEKVFEDADMSRILKEIKADGVFMGANPLSSISVLDGSIRWTLGMKTGKYGHTADKNGGTLITVKNGGKAFNIEYLVNRQ